MVWMSSGGILEKSGGSACIHIGEREGVGMEEEEKYEKGDQWRKKQTSQ